jgi:hypothetical protein
VKKGELQAPLFHVGEKFYQRPGLIAEITQSQAIFSRKTPTMI